MFNKEYSGKNDFIRVIIDMPSGKYLAAYEETGEEVAGYIDDESETFKNAAATMVNTAAEKLGIKDADGSEVTKIKALELFAEKRPPEPEIDK